jgi:gliding motility-associated-like protein
VVTPQNNLPVSAFGDTVICGGESVVLRATGAMSYQWTPASTLSDSTSANPTAKPNINTTYYVIGKDTAGCEGRDSVIVGIKTPVKVVASGDGQPISCNNSLAQLHASGADRYVWHPGVYLNDSTMAHPVATPPVNTLFTVEGVGINGCVGRDTIMVLVAPGAVHYIPNVFTPNADGLNDVVYPTIYCDFRFERFAMFNRWGEKLFETREYKKGWDGRYKGQYCDQGVYHYFISGTTSTGQPVLFKGNVTLLR